MTRSGHVYAISNIGSFGKDVYKVGMSRRLEPMDRVRELGDASAPFPLHVHAMIFTDDAPGLESATHRRIESNRLNSVNLRREFFVITPEPWLRKSRLPLLILVQLMKFVGHWLQLPINSGKASLNEKRVRRIILGLLSLDASFSY